MFAGRIFDRLELELGKDQVFFDVDAIPMGVDFRDHIKSSILQSAVLLAVIGKGWLKRHGLVESWFRARQQVDHVKVELEFAFEFGVPVLPVLVEGASMPSQRDLPPSLKRLATLNATRVGSGLDFRSDMERVLKVARSLKERNEGAMEQP